MSNWKRSLFAIAGTTLGSLLLGCPNNPSGSEADVKRLVAESYEGNAALLRGDITRYAALVRLAEDFTLMSPFGGKPSHGVPPAERMETIGKFFRNGVLQQELVQSYSTDDMVVLVVIERANVEAGGLPAQDWALRVTLVYRRDGARFRLVHRHADPLAHGISLGQAAALARGADAVAGTSPR